MAVTDSQKDPIFVVGEAWTIKTLDIFSLWTLHSVLSDEDFVVIGGGPPH